jgi:hypothetical protein
VVSAESLVVPYAASHGYAAGAAGALLACVPAGMAVGNLVVGRLVPPRARERLVGPLIAVHGLPLLALVAPVPAAVAGVLLGVAGAGFAFELGVQRRFLDAIPPGRRGQAFGLHSAGLMTVQGVAPVVSGAIASASSVDLAIGLAGGCTVLAAVLLGSRLRTTGRVPAGGA